MPGLTIEYCWHICNQNIVPQISCIERVSDEDFGGSFSLISPQKWSRMAVNPSFKLYNVLLNLGHGLKIVQNDLPNL
jgi:hypothetical protein